MNKKESDVIAFMAKRFPDAKCALVFSNPYECVCAVMLSAQTTDKSVNLVTPKLFETYPNPSSLAKANLEDVEAIIKSLGLYKNKAKNLIAMAQVLVDEYGGEVPSRKEDLVSLPGVGVKTANVVGAECFGTAAIAVDTHVSRVASRLGYVKEGTDPVKIEGILEKRFPKESHIKLHHQLIWFGREICHARKPDCPSCELGCHCLYFKKASSKTGK
ncbi:MAG: endonuclease III [Erysipelotrichaceae bacterium]|jgi:endonuclease-3|nr:endonuclease III [Erysipelotrichaceae bacterium]